MEKFSVKEIPRYPEVIHNPQLVLHDMKTVCKLCQNAYYKHPNGCPNFKTEGCPPYILHLTDQYYLSTIHMLLIKFPFAEYIEGKEKYHPDWTLRALANQRHWQLNILADLRKYWREIQPEFPKHQFIKNPEGQGTNVQATLLNHNIQLEWLEKDEDHNFISYPENMYGIYLIGKELEEIQEEKRLAQLKDIL